MCRERVLAQIVVGEIDQSGEGLLEGVRIGEAEILEIVPLIPFVLRSFGYPQSAAQFQHPAEFHRQGDARQPGAGRPVHVHVTATDALVQRLLRYEQPHEVLEVAGASGGEEPPVVVRQVSSRLLARVGLLPRGMQSAG